jgi:hypothetical protein
LNASYFLNAMTLNAMTLDLMTSGLTPLDWTDVMAGTAWLAHSKALCWFGGLSGSDDWRSGDRRARFWPRSGQRLAESLVQEQYSCVQHCRALRFHGAHHSADLSSGIPGGEIACAGFLAA